MVFVYSRCQSNLLDASWTKAAFATDCFSEAISFDDLWINDTFTDQLSDAVTFLDIEIDLRVIEQNDTNIAAVVLIDDTSSDVDEIFPGQAWSWSNTSISSVWHFDLDISLYQCFTTCRNNGVIGAVNLTEINHAQYFHKIS